MIHIALLVLCALVVMSALAVEDIGGARQWPIVPGIYLRQYTGLPFLQPFPAREYVVKGWLLLHHDKGFHLVHRGDTHTYDTGTVVEDAGSEAWTIVICT